MAFSQYRKVFPIRTRTANCAEIINNLYLVAISNFTDNGNCLLLTHSYFVGPIQELSSIPVSESDEATSNPDPLEASLNLFTESRSIDRLIVRPFLYN